jgi:hypothetical protein
VVFKKGLLKHAGRKIPCYEFSFPENVEVIVFGSFLENQEEWGTTSLLLWKNMDVALEFESLDGLPSRQVDLLLRFICQDFYPLRILHRPNLELKGDLSKTIFQRVKDDPDLLPMIRMVNFIRTMPLEALDIPDFWSGFLKILLPAVRNSNFEKINLLVQVMKYSDLPPAPIKLEIYERAIFSAFMRLRRVPTTGEIFEALNDNGTKIEERSVVNKALIDLGLGWLIASTKKAPQDTPDM